MSMIGENESEDSSTGITSDASAHTLQLNQSWKLALPIVDIGNKKTEVLKLRRAKRFA